MHEGLEDHFVMLAHSLVAHHGTCLPVQLHPDGSLRAGSIKLPLQVLCSFAVP